MRTWIDRLGACRLAVVLGTAALLVVVGAGSVYAQSPTPTGGTAPAAARGLRAGIFARTLHGELTLATKDGTKVVLYASGVISVGSGTVSVATRDGQTFSFTVTDKTRVRAKGTAIKFGQLETGDRAMVFGVKNATGGWDAILIRCVRSASGAAPSSAQATPNP
jgi:hypothetical protein